MKSVAFALACLVGSAAAFSEVTMMARRGAAKSKAIRAAVIWGETAEHA